MKISILEDTYPGATFLVRRVLVERVKELVYRNSYGITLTDKQVLDMFNAILSFYNFSENTRAIFDLDDKNLINSTVDAFAGICGESDWRW